MIKVNFFAGLVLLFLSACGHYDEPVASSHHTALSANHHVQVDDAVRIARMYVKGMNQHTRSENLNISSIEIHGRRPTRSGEVDENTLWGYYVINFENNSGFVLVSADDRNRPVYALSDEGTLNLADTVRNEGLRYYINSLPQNVSEVPSTSEWVIIPPDRPDPMVTSYKVVPPMLPLSVRTWGVHAPFNKYCIHKADITKRDVVGCVPLSACMVMSYYEWPKAYKDLVLNWDEMKSDHNSDVLAKFLKVLGDSDNLQATYGLSLTTASTGRLRPTFLNMGYPDLKESIFSEEKAIEILKQRHPLMIRGTCSSVPGWPVGKTSSHLWVIDGLYIQRILSGSTQSPQNFYIDTYYFHCVWGWDGNNNGYYYLDENKFSGSPTYIEPEETEDEVYGSAWQPAEMFYMTEKPE